MVDGLCESAGVPDTYFIIDADALNGSDGANGNDSAVLNGSNGLNGSDPLDCPGTLKFDSSLASCLGASGVLPKCTG